MPQPSQTNSSCLPGAGEVPQTAQQLDMAGERWASVRLFSVGEPGDFAFSLPPLGGVTGAALRLVAARRDDAVRSGLAPLLELETAERLVEERTGLREADLAATVARSSSPFLTTVFQSPPGNRQRTPAVISRWACEREAARPRSTSNWSARIQNEARSPERNEWSEGREHQGAAEPACMVEGVGVEGLNFRLSAQTDWRRLPPPRLERR